MNRRTSVRYAAELEGFFSLSLRRLMPSIPLVREHGDVGSGMTLELARRLFRGILVSRHPMGDEGQVCDDLERIQSSQAAVETV